MKAKSLALAGCLAAAMTALPVLSLAAPNSVTPERDGQVVRTQTLDLLKDLRANAVDASNRSAELQNVASSVASWEADAALLEYLKEDINSMGRTLTKLEEIRNSAAPEQQAAIDRAAPLLRLMVDNTHSAVTFLNEYEGRTYLPIFQKYTANLADESSQLSKSVGRYLQLAKTRSKEMHLEKTLGVEAGN